MGFSQRAPHPFATGLRAMQFTQTIDTIITGGCTPYNTIAKLAQRAACSIKRIK